MGNVSANIVERLDAALDGRVLSACILVGACLVAYSGSPFNGFVADDHAIVLDNPLVHGDTSLLDAFSTPYLDVMYRPMTIASFALQRQLFGPAAWSFHLVNVLLHALMTVLVWVMVRVLTRAGPTVAVVAGLVFAVHTLHTDAVSAVVGRSDLLAGVFAIGSFLAWRKWVAGGGHAAAAAAGALFLLGLSSKESAAPLLAFGLLWALHHLWRGREDGEPSRRPFAVLLGWLVAGALPFAVYGVARFAALGGRLVSAKNAYFGMVDAGSTVCTMLGVAARYAGLFLFPYPLSPDYTWESIPLETSPLNPLPLAGALILLTVIAATVVLLVRRGRPAAGAGAGLLWLLLFMAPGANVFPLMIPMAERMTYVASAGLCVVIAAGIGRAIAGRAAVPVLAGALMYIVVLTGMTVDRDRVWRDDLTLWSDTVATHPRSAVSLANLAGALIGSDRTNAGVAALERALDVGPWKWDFRVVLADVFHESGRHDDEARLLVEGLKWSHRSRPDPERICAAVVEVTPGLDRRGCLERMAGRSHNRQ